jgi:cyclic dehypoxanthinyl futalosine synthase
MPKIWPLEGNFWQSARSQIVPGLQNGSLWKPVTRNILELHALNVSPDARRINSMAITRNQALEYFRSDDLIGLGMEADAVRRKLHPEGVVTYIIDRNINYTNFCTEYCSFCAFYRPLKGKLASEGYILSFDTIYEKIAETLEMGGTGVLMQGGLHPDLKIEWFERLLRGIKQRFPQVWLHCFSASEILAIAEYSDLSVRDTIARLRDAGLASIPGGGAEILDDEVRRRIARLKCSTEDWVNVHRTAHELGMRTTATMMFGVGESFEQRVNHFEQVRRLQEETGGFTAFIPWSFQPKNTALGGRKWDEATAVEYLKLLAISRLYLDNIENVQSSWVTQGLKVLQLGLRFGGNDVGSVMLEENVVRAAGTSNCTTEEELRRVIRDAGFRPAQRDTLYTTFFLN